MSKFEGGGEVPSESVKKALEAHKETLDDITREAERLLLDASGDYDTAIEEATMRGRDDVVEKLHVIHMNKQQAGQ